MLWRIDRTAPVAVVTLALLLSPAAAGAPAGEAQQAQPPAPQAQPDGQSYLPPWMQKRDVAGIGSSAAGAPDPSNPIATQKPSVPTQGQRHQRRRQNDIPFLPRFW